MCGGRWRAGARSRNAMIGCWEGDGVRLGRMVRGGEEKREGRSEGEKEEKRRESSRQMSVHDRRKSPTSGTREGARGDEATSRQQGATNRGDTTADGTWSRGGGRVCLEPQRQREREGEACAIRAYGANQRERRWALGSPLFVPVEPKPTQVPAKDRKDPGDGVMEQRSDGEEETGNARRRAPIPASAFFARVGWAWQSRPCRLER